MICKICSESLLRSRKVRFLYGKRLKSYFIIFCNKCETGQVNYFPSNKEIFSFYNNIGTQKLFETKNKKNLLRFNKLDSLLEFIFFKSNHNIKNFINFLDIGAGTGRYCKQLQDLFNYNVEAIEPDKTKCELLRYFNIKYHNETFEDFYKKNKKKFNLIKLSQVLEHVSNPLSFLNNINKIMKKDSYLWIDIPNCNENYFNSRNNDLVGHLYFFNAKSIQYLSKLTNFKIISIGSFGKILKKKSFKENFIIKLKSFIYLYTPLLLLNLRKKYMYNRYKYKKINFSEENYFINSKMKFFENNFENEKLFILLKK